MVHPSPEQPFPNLVSLLSFLYGLWDHASLSLLLFAVFNSSQNSTASHCKRRFPLAPIFLGKEHQLCARFLCFSFWKQSEGFAQHLCMALHGRKGRHGPCSSQTLFNLDVDLIDGASLSKSVLVRNLSVTTTEVQSVDIFINFSALFLSLPCLFLT